MFLRSKSAPASAEDAGTAQDLADTLKADRERCVGLAANMIGVRRNIIIVQTQLAPIIMMNPRITEHSEKSYEAEEGCLSLPGTRKTKRYRTIKVQYQNERFQTRLHTFSGWTAQIIQHEIDHCNGILI